MVSWYLSSGSWVQTKEVYNAHRNLSISVPINFKSNCSAGSEPRGSTHLACYWVLGSAARLFCAINAMWLITLWKILSYNITDWLMHHENAHSLKPSLTTVLNFDMS